MSTDKIDLLFTEARQSEPYMELGGFEDSLASRLKRADWPPVWIRLGLPVVGALVGLAFMLLAFFNSGLIGYTAELTSLLTAGSISLPFWAMPVVSLLFTAAGLLAVKRILAST